MTNLIKKESAHNFIWNDFLINNHISSLERAVIECTEMVFYYIAKSFMPTRAKYFLIETFHAL